MRNPDFCKCENKDADQLRGNREADQRFCFRNKDSTIPLLPKREISSNFSNFSNCAARFVKDLVGIPEDRISRDAAHLILMHMVPPVTCNCAYFTTIHRCSFDGFAKNLDVQYTAIKQAAIKFSIKLPVHEKQAMPRIKST